MERILERPIKIRRGVAITAIMISLLSRTMPIDGTISPCIPDSTTAIAVAKAVLHPLIGSEVIDGEKALSFYASLDASPHDNIWHVEDAPPVRAQWVSPVIRVELEKDSGRILKVDDPIFVYDPPPFHVQENIWTADNPPKIGFVPDEQVAVDIAKAVTHPPSTHPFYAHLNKENEVWIVEDAPLFREKWTTPIMRVEIDKKSGRILRMGYQ